MPTCTRTRGAPTGTPPFISRLPLFCTRAPLARSDEPAREIARSALSRQAPLTAGEPSHHALPSPLRREPPGGLPTNSRHRAAAPTPPLLVGDPVPTRPAVLAWRSREPATNSLNRACSKDEPRRTISFTDPKSTRNPSRRDSSRDHSR